MRVEDPLDTETLGELFELFRTYEKGTLAFGIGAGVSQASRLPDWKELVTRIAQGIGGGAPESAQALIENGFDAIAVATVMREHCGDPDEFAEHVRRSLYRDFDFPLRLRKENRAEFAQHVRATNPTLHAVGTFCAVSRSKGWQPNPRLRAIVTLNMDALLQMYTRSRFQRRILRTVERASAGANPARVSTYHVHGFLVRDGISPRQGDRRAIEAPDRLVLTEQQYFDVVASVHGFVNYSLLHLLREHRFLFVGLSMTDANLRRALHLSYQERVRELMSEGEPHDVAKQRATRHWAIVRKESRSTDEALAILLRVVGVKAFWVTRWSDIPPVLQAIYESTGDKWSDVS